MNDVLVCIVGLGISVLAAVWSYKVLQNDIAESEPIVIEEQVYICKPTEVIQP